MTSDTHYVVNNVHKAVPDRRLPKMHNETDFGDLRLILLPPGQCDVHHKIDVAFFDINFALTEFEMAVNSDRQKSHLAQAEATMFVPCGTEFKIRVTNKLPGCVLEVRNETLHSWMDACDIADTDRDRYSSYAQDGVAANLGRAAIRHLMRSTGSKDPVDRLTVEALALGIAARGMARLGSSDGDIDAEIVSWSARGRPGAIAHAIDLLECRLCEPELKISDLAKAAGLSSSHFSSVFKSITGETPYSFVLRRRAEYARDLVIGTHEPLSWVAYEAGFSSQAHMTTVFGAVFCTTPAAMRDG